MPSWRSNWGPIDATSPPRWRLRIFALRGPRAKACQPACDLPASSTCSILARQAGTEVATMDTDAIQRTHEWLKEVYARQPERDTLHTTISGEELKPLYTQEDLADTDVERDVGYPGEYPF